MWMILFNLPLPESDVEWNHKMEMGEKVVSKVCLSPCWVQMEDGLCGHWAGWIALSSNGRDIFYYLLVNTRPPTMTTTDRFLQQATGLCYSVTEPHWHLLLSLCNTKALCLTNTDLSLKHEQGLCLNENVWPLNPTIQSFLLWRWGLKGSKVKVKARLTPMAFLSFRNSHVIQSRHTFKNPVKLLRWRTGRFPLCVNLLLALQEKPSCIPSKKFKDTCLLK